jgi:surface protein
MDDSPITDEEISSQLTGLNKGIKEPKKKLLLIGISLGVLFVIFLITIIVLLSSSKNKEKEINLPVIGEINCIYDIQSTGENTILLGEEFDKTSEFDIFIDDQKIKYTKEYKFDKAGQHKVQIKLYENINMDYMFKDVHDIISVEMKSDKNCQITSMISVFENCESFYNFTLIGFGADNLKSMQKLFYKSWLNQYSFTSFNTLALEDISYMFASTYIDKFNLKDINTNRVSDMSHLFDDCSSLEYADFTGFDTSSVKDMSYIFHSCTAIKELDLSGFKTGEVVNMSSMFQE